VAAYRPDLLSDYGSVPRRYEDVLRLGAAARRDGRYLGLACRDPHGFLVAAALAANLGAAPAVDPLSEPFDRHGFAGALTLLRQLTELMHPDCLGWNAIDLQDAMVRRDDIVYCPLVYGYYTYAEADQRRALRYADAPGVESTSPHGTVLGGTGLGVTRSCRDTAAALAFLDLMGDGGRQRRLIAPNHGQPAHLEAWTDPAADARFGGALSATRRTIDLASIRPRYPGAVPLQHACGAIVAGFCAGAGDVAGTLALLRQAWQRTRSAIGRG
jgi:multiple sugar transport system substrate-binding protein